MSPSVPVREYSACSSASSTRSVFSDFETRQPTIRRAKTSMTKATYTNPAQVVTYVISATHSALGRLAVNWRSTRSPGRSVASSPTVVRQDRPRTTPCRPILRIRRSTVQRATALRSRLSWRQTLRAPYTWKFSSQTRRISLLSSTSRRPRGTSRAGSASPALWA